MREHRGFDFTGYKQASLSGRFQRRMELIGVGSLQDYMGLLQANPGEFGLLFNTILINVTGFFRDASTWDYLEKHVIERLAAHKEGLSPISAWSAGCATGEEAYSAAELLANRMGDQEFRERVKIYSTDADEDAQVAATVLSPALYVEQASRLLRPGCRNCTESSSLRGAGVSPAVTRLPQLY